MDFTELITGFAARELLEANAALRKRSGAILCQDPETKAFAAIRSVPLQMADPTPSLRLSPTSCRPQRHVICGRV
jgi:hypothetical protein